MAEENEEGNHSYATPPSRPQSQQRTRVSPYPTRNRTPIGTPISTTLRAATQQAASDHTRTPSRPTRVSLDSRATTSPATTSTPSRAATNTQSTLSLYQLTVRPLVKSTVGQRDSTGTVLDDFIVTGGSFADITQKLWDKYHHQIKGRAVKTEDGWCMVAPERTDWNKLMQLKFKKKVVDNSKTDSEWSAWLVRTRGQPVTLMIYHYGLAIARQVEFDEFTEACIRPDHTDRSGAAAEPSVKEMAIRLQDQWRDTYQAPTVTWRMWATDVMRSNPRAMWDAAIARGPPSSIQHLFQPAMLPEQQQLDSLSEMVMLAMECVNASIADARRLRSYVDALADYLTSHEERLETRKVVLSGVARNLQPRERESVQDPLIDNVEDTEHQ